MSNRNRFNNANRWATPGIESLSTRRDWRDSELAHEFEKYISDSLKKVREKSSLPLGPPSEEELSEEETQLKELFDLFTSPEGLGLDREAAIHAIRIVYQADLEAFRAVLLTSLEKKSAIAKILADTQAQEKTAGVSDSAEKAKVNLEDANEAAESLLSTLGEQNLASDKDEEEEDPAITEEEYKEAKETLLLELTKMAYNAADGGDTVLAYKIERAISEITEEA